MRSRSRVRGKQLVSGDVTSTQLLGSLGRNLVPRADRPGRAPGRLEGRSSTANLIQRPREWRVAHLRRAPGQRLAPSAALFFRGCLLAPARHGRPPREHPARKAARPEAGGRHGERLTWCPSAAQTRSVKPQKRPKGHGQGDSGRGDQFSHAFPAAPLCRCPHSICRPGRAWHM